MLQVNINYRIPLQGERWALLLSCGHWEIVTIRDVHNSEQEFMRKKLSPRAVLVNETTYDHGTVPKVWKCYRYHTPVQEPITPRMA